MGREMDGCARRRGFWGGGRKWLGEVFGGDGDGAVPAMRWMTRLFCG